MAGDPAHRTVKVGERRLRVLEDRDLPAELAASSALQSGSQPCTAWPTTNEPGSRDLPTRASRAVPGSPRKEGRGHRADSLPDRVARPRRPAGPVDPVRREVRTPLRGHDASPPRAGPQRPSGRHGEPAIQNSTQSGAVVLDPFAGSGATFAVAERTARPCAGPELDPTYVEVALRRWERFSGLCGRAGEWLSGPASVTSAIGQGQDPSGGKRSTNGARHSGASNGAAYQLVVLAIFPPRSSTMARSCQVWPFG